MNNWTLTGIFKRKDKLSEIDNMPVPPQERTLGAQNLLNTIIHSLPRAMADRVNNCLQLHAVLNSRSRPSDEESYLLTQIFNKYLPEIVDQYNEAADTNRLGDIVDGQYTLAQICDQNIAIIEQRLQLMIEHRQNDDNNKVLTQRRFLQDMLSVDSLPEANEHNNLLRPSPKTDFIPKRNHNHSSLIGKTVLVELNRWVDEKYDGNIEQFQRDLSVLEYTDLERRFFFRKAYSKNSLIFGTATAYLTLTDGDGAIVVNLGSDGHLKVPAIYLKDATHMKDRAKPRVTKQTSSKSTHKPKQKLYANDWVFIDLPSWVNDLANGNIYLFRAMTGWDVASEYNKGAFLKGKLSPNCDPQGTFLNIDVKKHGRARIPSKYVQRRSIYDKYFTKPLFLNRANNQ